MTYLKTVLEVKFMGLADLLIWRGGGVRETEKSRMTPTFPA